MSGMPKRLLASMFILLAMVCTVLLQSVSYARANTITVNNLTDPSTITANGFCTLREAIINANNAGTDQTGGDCTAGSGTDTINFSLSGTITLSSTLPNIANVSPNSLTIDGTGVSIVVDGANLYQILYIDVGSTFTLKSITIAHGYRENGDGAGIYNNGALSVINCTLSDNKAHHLPNGSGDGGAILNAGAASLIVSNSTFSNNLAELNGGAIRSADVPINISNSTFSNNISGFGGAISAGGTDSNPLIVSNSTFVGNAVLKEFGGRGGAISCFNTAMTNNIFSGNTAYNSGGAVDCFSGSINSSVFSENSASFGGGLFVSGGAFSVVNSTFSTNSVYLETGDGGGAIAAEGSNVTINNSTFSGNSAAGYKGGAIYDNFSTFTISNSILANSPGGNCGEDNGAILNNGGHNISDDGTCGFGTSTSASGKTIGDNVDPLLVAAGLQDNGGPTKTIALQATSRAINGIPKALCPATDQRGALRPATGHTACTIGAFEFAGVIPVPALTIAPTSLGFLTVGIGTTKSLTLTIKNTAKGGTLTGNVPTLAAPFNVTAGGGAFNLTAGQVKSVTVQFTPTTPSAVTTNLVITSNDPKKPSVTIKVTGTGQAGQLSVPSTLTFFTKPTVPKTGTLTIRNLGLGILHGNVGDSIGPFVVTAGGGAFTLNHLQTKVVTIQFTPPAKGPFAGVLPLLSDDPKHLSFNVNLKGTGQ